MSKFSLIPPQLKYIVDEVGLYFRWFEIGSSTIKDDYFINKTLPYLIFSCWIDGLNQQVKLRSTSIVEIALHSEKD